MKKDLLRQINSNDIATVEDGLKAIIADKRKSLAEIFKKQKQINETGLCTIPLLENILTKNSSKFSSAVLSKVFEFSFRKITDNYQVTLIIAGEFIKRNDKKAQYAAIRSFIMASSDYNPKYLHHSYVVHDQLIEKYFTRFESAPLVFLLSWWQKERSVFFGNKLKGKMETLMLSAFSRVSNEKTFKSLLEILKVQMTKSKQGDELIEQSEVHIPSRFSNHFVTWKRDNSDRILRAIWLEQLKVHLHSDLTERIEQGVNQIDILSAKEWKIISDALRSSIQNRELKWHTRLKLFNLFLDHNDREMYAKLIISLAHEDVDRLKELLNSKYSNAELAIVLKETLKVAAIDTLKASAVQVSEEVLNHEVEEPGVSGSDAAAKIRQWAKSLDGTNLEIGIGLEIAAIINYSVRELEFDYLIHALTRLENYSGMVDLTERRHYFKTFADELKSVLLLKSNSQKTKVLKMLALNMRKIKLEPCVEDELMDMFKKHRVMVS